MDKLITEFNKLYPNFAGRRFSGTCNIIEHENYGKPGTFQRLDVTVSSKYPGWKFSRQFLEATKSFHEKSIKSVADTRECHNIMMRECDGMFCTQEDDGTIKFHVFELKSGFSKENIIKAKNQIVGSYLKMIHLLAPLQAFDLSRIRVTGYIVAYKPTVEFINAIKDDGRAGYFCIQLDAKGQYHMPASKCAKYWHPLSCGDIDINFIKVPHGMASHSVTV